MRTRRKSRGYTIVEVMIFLAISGFMFLIAAVFVNGKQGKAEFRQSLNDINNQLQQTINDVNNGLYPWPGNLACTAPPGSPPQIQLGTSNQGGNEGCVFLGKVIQFGTEQNNESGYNIYSVAARQYVTTAADGTIPTNFNAAQPEVIYVNGGDPTEYKQFSYGMTVKCMFYEGGKINAIGFFSSFGSYAKKETLASGAQDVVVLPLKAASGTVNPPASSASVRDAVHNIRSTDNSEIDFHPNIEIWFDGGNGQFGQLSIGSKGQRLTTDVQINNTLPNGC